MYIELKERITMYTIAEFKFQSNENTIEKKKQYIKRKCIKMGMKRRQKKKICGMRKKTLCFLPVFYRNDCVLL